MTRRWRPGRDRQAVRHAARPGALRASDPAPSVLVVGGGIAGITAAVGLAERGVRVRLVERQPQLGGRVRSWPVRHGEDTAVMSRGFHAFFRQYYNLRQLLRRVDPALDGLTAVPDYPVRRADGTGDTFAGLPRTPPLNLLAYALRNPHFGVSGLRRADLRAAMGMLDVRFPGTFAEHDGQSAAEFLDELNFPPAVRQLALEVFARSFFADPAEFSAGELLAMFHLYFVGSAEGLLFDVARDDFGTVCWSPLQRYLERLGVEVSLGSAVTELDVPATGSVRAVVDGEIVTVDATVLAGDVRSMRSNLAVTGLPNPFAATANSPRFAVWRLWLDRPVAAGRPAFLGTGGFELVDNVSVLERFEAGARDWAARRRGSVVEVHAYALPDGASDRDLRRRLRADLSAVYPETASATVLADEWVMAQDCPSWGPGRWAIRPAVRTADPRVVTAGDATRCELPVALMERAATTGWQAANALLGDWGLRGHDLWTVPVRSRVPGISAVRSRLGRSDDQRSGDQRSGSGRGRSRTPGMVGAGRGSPG